MEHTIREAVRYFQELEIVRAALSRFASSCWSSHSIHPLGWGWKASQVAHVYIQKWNCYIQMWEWTRSKNSFVICKWEWNFFQKRFLVFKKSWDIEVISAGKPQHLLFLAGTGSTFLHFLFHLLKADVEKK